MRGNEKGLLSAIEDSVDLIINIAATLGAYFFAEAVFGGAAVDIGSYKTLLLLFIAITLTSAVYRFFGVNDPRRYHLTPSHRAAAVVIANFCYFSLSAISSAIFAEREKLAFLLFWTVTAGALSTVSLILKKELAARLWRAASGSDAIKKLLIVGTGGHAAGEFIKEVIRSSGSEFMIIGAVGDAPDETCGCEYLGDIPSLGEILDKYEPHIAVFSVDGYDRETVIGAVNLCDDRCVKVYFLPTAHGYFKTAKQIDYIGELPLVCVHATPLEHRACAAIKRAVDIIGALFLIIFTSPVMIATAIGVKLSSPGPILFRQVRIGRRGVPFRILKFRSMRLGGDDTAWSTGIDTRKTRFGNFIRRTSIDELPQLFNVLRGEMSLVGPRPEIPRFVEYFRERVPLYMIKHYAKPGMTGLAQINGLRGNTSIEERIKADVYYIENWSLALDIEILLKTPFKAINKNEKLEGEDNADGK